MSPTCVCYLPRLAIVPVATSLSDSAIVSFPQQLNGFSSALSEYFSRMAGLMLSMLTMSYGPVAESSFGYFLINEEADIDVRPNFAGHRHISVIISSLYKFIYSNNLPSFRLL
jgi:hypothetical protein